MVVPRVVFYEDCQQREADESFLLPRLKYLAGQI